MASKQKIITMSKMAVYDKGEGAADRAVFGYFRHDYIYRKNLGTRLSVGTGAAVLLLVYWAEKAINTGLDAIMLELTKNITDSILFVLAVMAAYTVAGTIQGTRQYYLAQKRLQKYHGMLRLLDRIEERARRKKTQDENEEGPAGRNGNNTNRKGNRR